MSHFVFRFGSALRRFVAKGKKKRRFVVERKKCKSPSLTGVLVARDFFSVLSEWNMSFEIVDFVLFTGAVFVRSL